MIFSSVTFILYFLAPLLVVYYLVPKKTKDPVLLGASVVFIACCGLKLCLIPILAAAANYFYGILLSKHRTKPILYSGVAVNVLLIIIFRLLMQKTDILYIAPDMLLFCGMCYGGMRAVTYLADIYAGKTAVQRNPVSFGLYMLYFPLFANGPVIRYNDFRQLVSNRRLIGVRFLSGAGLFICGLLKKLILADRLRAIWQAVSGYDFTGLSLVNAWFGLIALVLYIYFMFTAFWDMGIGISRMLGIDAQRRVHPIRYFEEFNFERGLRLAPLLIGFICVMSAMTVSGLGQFTTALFRFGYIGWGEQDFMYRFTSNIGLLLLSIFVASGVSRFVIDALKPTKVRNTPFANGVSLAVMAALIAAAGINLISVAKSPTPENSGSLLDGSMIRTADSRISKNSFFTDRFFHLNADIGFILGQKGLNGVHYAKDGSLIERSKPYSEAAVDRFVEDMDYIADAERYNMHIAVVPPAFEHMKDRLKPYTYDDRVVRVKERIQYLLSDSAMHYLDCSARLFGATNNDRMFEYNSKNLTADGGYALYAMLGDALGYEPYLLSSFDRIVTEKDVRGELWKKAGYDLAPRDTRERLAYRNSTVTTGYETDLTVYNSNAQNGRSLVVIASDEVKTALDPLAEHFDIVYVLPAYLPTENIKSFIDANYVTDVLVLCGTDTIISAGTRMLGQ